MLRDLGNAPATHSQKIRQELAQEAAEAQAADPRTRRKLPFSAFRWEAERRKKCCGANRSTPFCEPSPRDPDEAGAPERREVEISYWPRRRRGVRQVESGWRNSNNPSRQPEGSAPRKCKVRCAVTYESGPQKRVQFELQTQAARGY